MRNLLLAISLFTVILLAGCGKDDDGTVPNHVIVATGITGDTENIVKVRATIYHYSQLTQLGKSLFVGIQDESSIGSLSDGSSDTRAETASNIVVTADFIDNSFRLELPKTIGEAYLSPLADFYQTAKISDRTASICFLSLIYALNDADQQAVGRILCTDATSLSSPKSLKYIVYMYADKPVTITGHNNMSNYDLSLNKGWNTICYELSSSGIDSYMSTIPSGLSWKIFPY